MESQPVSPQHFSLPTPPQRPWQGTHCTLQQSIPSDCGGVLLMKQWGGHLRQWVTVRKTIKLYVMLNTYLEHCKWLSTIHAAQTQSLTPSSDNDTSFSLSTLRLCNLFTTANKFFRDRLTSSSAKEVNFRHVTRESTKGSTGTRSRR